MKTSDVLLHFGNKSKVSKALGITKSAISQWGDVVPKLRAYEIEIVTKGELKASKEECNKVC